jgi:hypothetical protein
MEIQLRFNLTYTDGTTEVQEFRMPAAPRNEVEQEILKAMLQYGNFGMLKKLEKEDRWVLVPANRIARVEIDMPSIALASGADANALKGSKISLAL